MVLELIHQNKIPCAYVGQKLETLNMNCFSLVKQHSVTNDTTIGYIVFTGFNIVPDVFHTDMWTKLLICFVIRILGHWATHWTFSVMLCRISGKRLLWCLQYVQLCWNYCMILQNFFHQNTDKNTENIFDKKFLIFLTNFILYIADSDRFWICFEFLPEQHKFLISIDKKVEKTFNKSIKISYDSDKSLNKTINKTYINFNDKHFTSIYFLYLRIIFLLFVLKFICLKYMLKIQNCYLKRMNRIIECLWKDFVSYKSISRNLPIKNVDIIKKTLIKICDFGLFHLVLKLSYRISKYSSASKKLTLEISNILLDMKYITEQNNYTLFFLIDLKAKSLRFYPFFIFYFEILSHYFCKVNLLSLNNFNLLPWLLKI